MVSETVGEQNQCTRLAVCAVALPGCRGGSGCGGGALEVAVDVAAVEMLLMAAGSNGDEYMGSEPGWNQHILL